MEYHSSIKKNNATCHIIDGPRVYHTEWSETEGEISWHALYVESKKKWYKWTYLKKTERLTDLEKELYGCWGGGGGAEE